MALENSVWNLKRPSFRLFLLVFGLTGLLFLTVRYLFPALFYPYRFFLELQARLGFFGIYLLILVPAVAIGILMVSKWGWYLFLIFYIQLAIYVALQIPLHSTQSVFWLILLLAAVFIVVWALMSRTVREPFFSAEDRGWRFAKRIPLKLPAKFYIDEKSYPAISRDISITGALLESQKEISTDLLPMVNRVEFTFSGFEIVSLPCKLARLVQVPDKTYFALAFRKEDKESLNKLRSLLRSKYRNRHLFRKDALLVWPGEKRLARVYNISRGGCYLETDTKDIKEGDDVMVRIDLGPKTHVERGGQVVWLNPKGEYGKHPGVGIRFTDSLLMHPFFAIYYLFRIKNLPLVR